MKKVGRQGQGAFESARTEYEWGDRDFYNARVRDHDAERSTTISQPILGNDITCI